MTAYGRHVIVLKNLIDTSRLYQRRQGIAQRKFEDCCANDSHPCKITSVWSFFVVVRKARPEALRSSHVVAKLSLQDKIAVERHNSYCLSTFIKLPLPRTHLMLSKQ